MRLPLRLRLTLAFACAMALVLSALGAFLYLRLGAELLRSIDAGLGARADVIAAGLGTDDFTDQSGHLIDADEAFAQILDVSGSEVIADSSPRIGGAPLVPTAELRTIEQPTYLSRRILVLQDDARLLVVPVHEGSPGRFIVVGAILSDRREALLRLLVLFAIGGPVALVVTSAAGWLLAGAALRPVERMRKEAAAISASEPERRLQVPATGDELERLAATLNDMLRRLQEALEKERRFVDDASHELRTPLATLKAELDLALARARTPEELEAVVARASIDTDRLAHLADDLLVLSRSDGGRLPVHRVDVSLDDVVRETCEGHRRQAEDLGVHLRDDDVPAVHARLDPIRVRQALDNLLDNALRFTPAGGEVLVGAASQGGVVRLVVQDTGPGFSPDLTARAFEPFVRGDGPANDAWTGAGLGLAIVRAVATAHGGTATAENRSEGGARVTVLLRM